MQSLRSLLIQAHQNFAYIAVVSVGMSFAPSLSTRILSVLRKDGAKHVVDNFGGVDDFVVAGSDWRCWWQLNTSAVSDRRDRFDPATDYRPPSRDLATAARVSCFVSCFEGAR